MPLVDYASSDEDSENENESEADKKKGVVQTNVNRNASGDGDGELFSSLPKPKKTFSFPEDRLGKLLLNRGGSTPGKRESVQISVPSVSEFEEDSAQPAPKKLKPSAKGAGLFSILPPPKNASAKQTATHLVPHAVSKNHARQTLPKGETGGRRSGGALARDADADEEDDDVPVGNSFFGSSLQQQNSRPDPEDLSGENSSAAESATGFKADSFESESALPEQNSSLSLGLDTDDNDGLIAEPARTVETMNASDNPLELDEKALQILCGNKKKRQQMPMNIIELSGEEILPDSKEWLLKQFTEERRGRSHCHKKSHGPSSQSRRKHQITYLAYQAKEQELELQNMWANNRMSRKQTQSKYGF